MDPGRADLSPAILTTVRALAVDSVTAEVAEGCAVADLPFLLLKGPVTARWLYGDGVPRGYGDTDLLVPPDREDAAERVLAGLGFAPDPGTGQPDPGIARNHVWRRGEEVVELHVTLTGVGAPPPVVWETLSAEAEETRVAGARVAALSRRARVLHLALHAAQHGRREAKPLEDLARGLHVIEDPEWRRAAELAHALEAIEAMGAGLRLLPAGSEVADRLGLPAPTTPDIAMRAASAGSLGFGIERLMQAPGIRAKTRRVWRAVVPTPAFLRWWHPLARRGRLGLALVYVWRPVWLAVSLPRAVAVWLRARGHGPAGGIQGPPQG